MQEWAGTVVSKILLFNVVIFLNANSSYTGPNKLIESASSQIKRYMILGISSQGRDWNRVFSETVQSATEEAALFA